MTSTESPNQLSTAAVSYIQTGNGKKDVITLGAETSQTLRYSHEGLSVNRHWSFSNVVDFINL